MTPFLTHREIYNHPILLDSAEIKNPLLVPRALFEKNDLAELKAMQEKVVTACLTGDLAEFQTPQARADLLAYYSEINRLLEANSLLAKNNKLRAAA